MPDALTFRWLGVAGVELAYNGQVLAVDPFFSRPSFWQVWFGRPRPNRQLSTGLLPRCDHILVSHAHHDHIMDVPDIAAHSGAQVYGSANSCALVAACGLPSSQICQVGPGQTFTAGDFEVSVLPAGHIRLPGFDAGQLPQTLTPPLRIRDYRMDTCTSFLVRAGGTRILLSGGGCPVIEEHLQVDVLFAGSFWSHAAYQGVLEATRPGLFIPIHWDDFMRPLSKPVRPMLRLNPIRTINPAAFEEVVRASAPGARFLVPEIFVRYPLYPG